MPLRYTLSHFSDISPDLLRTILYMMSIRILEEAGVVVLRDEVENLEGLTIVGRRDASSAERKSTWNLTEAADTEPK